MKSPLVLIMLTVMVVPSITLCFGQDSSGDTPTLASGMNGMKKSYTTGPQHTERMEGLRLNEISSKAVRNFMADYKEAVNVKWLISPNGLYVVTFEQDNLKCWRCYNKQGNVEFTIRYYGEDKLPRDVRHLIKREYYDYSIFKVIEYTKNGELTYIVKMEDNETWKTVKVSNGEMELIEDYIKG